VPNRIKSLVVKRDFFCYNKGVYFKEKLKNILPIDKYVII